ncbi:MAG: hypothetical protein D6B28_01005 [Gammaproteobacteria bacterium]|nr:MAG: hypothetical protein D6B28_01005 [Gammaproteobacteria bacterium]
MNIHQLLGPSGYENSGKHTKAAGNISRGTASADLETQKDGIHKVSQGSTPVPRKDLEGTVFGQTAGNTKADALADKQTRLNQDSHQYKDLTDSEKQMINELRIRDREVRAHEQAHKAVAGNLAGPVQYSFQTGPDGKKYAIGGEVDIDTSSVPGNPEATARKAEQIIRAAYAAAEPSPQDRRVAAAAQQMLVQARQELRNEEITERAYEQEMRAERAKEAREKAEEEVYEVLKPEEQVDFFENANLIEAGGAEVIDLIQAGNETRKADLPDIFSDSVLAFEGSSAVIEQFLATQEMVSIDGFMNAGGRMDIYA